VIFPDVRVVGIQKMIELMRCYLVDMACMNINEMIFFSGFITFSIVTMILLCIDDLKRKDK
jgi:hypothetical protein